MSSPAPSEPPIPDSPPHNPTLPLPLSASIVLTSLPKDASSALAEATADERDIPPKVTIRFQPIGSAPQLRQKVFKISSTHRFESVVAFLRKKLGVGVDGGHVFCYVNSVFAPSLDEGVGGLWRCFKTEDQLTVAYSMTPAFG
ncbi:MAG: hypothetical protein LQ351_005977 [Letrouitia transgressa]|nr:MAG: hypothetical protein LQ351_005977 [Letrouitia transgressa]